MTAKSSVKFNIKFYFGFLGNFTAHGKFFLIKKKKIIILTLHQILCDKKTTTTTTTTTTSVYKLLRRNQLNSINIDQLT